MIRIGHGYDAHRFAEEKLSDSFITIGGVQIHHPFALIAHSDGDVLLHALCDSLLGALALGDIGKHFPDNSSEYKDIDSRKLLREVYKHIENRDYEIGNMDITIVAQSPKMATHLNSMKTRIAEDCRCNNDQINIKATTTEKMGFTGRKEGIACHAVVLLAKKTT